MSQSFHDDLINDALARPIPNGDPPDPLDVLLIYCRRFYGPELAREKAIAAIRRQKTKGIKTYGQPLNADTLIDWDEYLLEEAVDLAAYARGLP